MSWDRRKSGRFAAMRLATVGLSPVIGGPQPRMSAAVARLFNRRSRAWPGVATPREARDSNEGVRGGNGVPLTLILGGEVFVGPTADLLERRQQRAAGVGELVGDRDWRAFVDGAGDQSRAGQPAEPGGQHRVADPFDRPREFAE